MAKNTHIVNTSSNTWSDKITDKIDTIKDLGLDWHVSKNPLVTLLDGKYPLPIQSHVSVNRSDSNEPIGIVGKGYEPIQNSRIWEAMHNSLDGTDHEIVGGGYTHNGGRVFIQTQINDENFKVNGDDFSNYVTFYSSHDGSSAFELFDTATRIICQNTMQPARRKGGKHFKLKVRHTSNASIRFDNVMEHLESIFDIRRQVFSDLQTTAELPMAYDEMIAWATSFFNKTNKLSTVSANKASETVRLARNGIGNNGETRYDMLNGVTELLTHGDSQSSKNRADIWRASEFGASATTKSRSLDALLNYNNVTSHINRGRDLMRNLETTLTV